MSAQERERAKDRIRAAAWALAAATSRSEAEQFLQQVARQVSDADWNRR